MPHAESLHAITRILAQAGRGADRQSLFRRCLEELATLFQCRGAGVWLTDGTVYRVVRGGDRPAFSIGHGHPATAPPARILAQLHQACPPDIPAADIQARLWWTADASRCQLTTDAQRDALALLAETAGSRCVSLLAAAFDLQSGPPGLLALSSHQREHFNAARRALFGQVGPLFDIALANWRVGQALRERVKELSCLYRMARIDVSPESPIEGRFNDIAAIVSAAWLHSDDARVRIEFDGQAYGDNDFPNNRPVMASPIVVEGNPRGRIAVAYTGEHPPMDEGPFLAEERSLMDTIARELGRIAAREDFRRQRARMQERLAHTDRLNMMGQLSATIAHEINEPLTAMLGYAQLAIKTPGLPPQAQADIDRIITTCLHAREIVRKLLMFSRDMPARMETVSVHRIIDDTLELFKARCAKERIDIRLRLTRGRDTVCIDPARLRQVFSNLILNALQAMPHGGRLTLTTRRPGRRLVITVEDTGCGMSEAELQKAFIPFYTTKPHHQGTGLGLPVVQQIVNDSAGQLSVDSRPGRGTRFTLSFPVRNGF
jgi:two-component system, NtrC family, sensor kinase